LRHIDGQYLDKTLLEETFRTHPKKGISFPAKGKLKIPGEDQFDELIAVWVDYFNKKLKLETPLDPHMIKALIASESTFEPNAVNKNASGLTQITTDTLKILQDLGGESKEFVFKDIKKKDLKDPNTSIALGVRWLAYKKKYAERILKRTATSDETIQVYKGILGDKSGKAIKIMHSFRGYYEKIKNSGIALIGFILGTTGCQTTKPFEIKKLKEEELYVVDVDRNRIIHECYFMNAEKENNWRHQYFLYILDNQNEAIALLYPTNQGKEECLAHLKKVESILKTKSRLKLCIRGELKRGDYKNSPPEFLDFGPLGKHESPYDAFQFDTICNSKECFSISDTWTYTCPNFKK
jgi:hypothetical protein